MAECRNAVEIVPYQNAEHEFIVSIAGNAEWGHTGNASVGAEPFTALTAKGFVGKGFGDVEAEWLRPFAVTGEVDYTWSTHPIDVTGIDPDTGLVSIDRSPTVVTYGATLQYSLLYMNSFVHEVPEFFRKLIPDIEVVFSTPVSNIGPSTLGAIPGTHQTTGTWGPGLYYFFRIGPLLNSVPWRNFQSITRVADMSVCSPSWISSSTTYSPIRSANRSSGRVRPASGRSIEEVAMSTFIKPLLAAALAARLLRRPSSRMRSLITGFRASE